MLFLNKAHDSQEIFSPLKRFAIFVEVTIKA